MSERVRSERRGAVVLLTLDRPKALNALDRTLLEQLEQAVGAVAADGSVRALVVTGEGRAFAAGADVAAMTGFDPLEGEAFSRLGQRTFDALEALEIPTIAAVNGYALGGGCELALACDWIYASEEARFGLPEVRLGILPGFGGTVRLARRVGIAWAKEIATTGEPIDAQEALRIGLVNRVFAPGDLMAAAWAAGESIAARGPLAVAAAKRVIQEGQDADVRAAFVLEQQAFGRLFGTDDRHEGMAAFLEKRDPVFKGR